MRRVIQVTGTNGSGKSTVVRRVIDSVPTGGIQTVHVDWRQRPLGYRLRGMVWVPGHYEVVCGGCDTLPTQDMTFGTVREEVLAGRDSLFEGILAQQSFARAVQLKRDLEPVKYVRILLNLPLEECLESVRERRRSKGNEKPLNTRNATNAWRAVYSKSGQATMREAGIEIIEMDRESAYQYCLDELALR